MPIFSHKFSGLFMSKNKSKPEPVVIHDSLGTFTLNRKNYEGEVKLPECEITVFLETDGEEETTAFASLQSLRAFVKNAADWDERIRQFAADDFAGKDGTIEIWGDCDGNNEGGIISKDEFMRRISMNFIQFYADGSLFFDYDLDEMFTDHGLGVHAHISGRIESCALWG
ncbi:MAG: DUF2262 domain-containing protein [Clostridia bacterium]|nr:DUF2262 domain-containing protein [Clostridia bacterium]